MSSIVEDFESRDRLSESRDPAVRRHLLHRRHSTRLDCRPELPGAATEARERPLLPTAAAAQSAGFRACKRCRPDAAPGSPDWNWRADRVARAMRLIADGTVDREGVPGLARRLGFSERHLRRLLAEQVGATPVGTRARQRANTARLLIESTAMSFADVSLCGRVPQRAPIQRHDQRRLRLDPERDAAPVKGISPAVRGSRRASPGLPGTIRRGRAAAVPRSAGRPRSRRGQRRHLSASAHAHSRCRGRQATPEGACRPLRPPSRRSSRPRSGRHTLSAVARPRRRPAGHRRGARPRRGARRPRPGAAGRECPAASTATSRPARGSRVSTCR